MARKRSSSRLQQLQRDLLARLGELARNQTTISAQDLRTGNFVPAFAASLLPQLAQAGLLERTLERGMHGGTTYVIRTTAPWKTTWGKVTTAIETYLATLGERGFEYHPPEPATPAGPYTKRATRAIAET